MSASMAVLVRLQQRAQNADQLISVLKSQLESIRKTAVAKACLAEQEKLSAENASLRVEVDRLKGQLIAAEVKNGVQQVPLPQAALAASCVATACTSKGAVLAKNASQPVADEKKEALSKAESKPNKSEPKAKQIKSEKPASASPVAPLSEVDVSRLNMRIGRIISAKRHPDADNLYVEDVDVGEPKTRTIVSGLVSHIPIEEMQNRYAVFLLNLKPAKMRGILSEGMIMCASSLDKVEIIIPPQDVTVGERVVVQGYPGEPDDQLNPKKKTWESIQPDLRINAAGQATYKGALWYIDGKGNFKAKTMTNSAIK